MSKPKLRVEWNEPPDEWVMPAALAFEAALLERGATAPTTAGSGTLVVHVCVFAESARPAGIVGDPLSMPFETANLIASPITHPMSLDTVLNSSFVLSLWETGRASKILVFAVLVVVLIHVVDPFHTMMGGSNYDSACQQNACVGMSFKARNVFVMMTETVLVMILLFLTAHVANAAMLKCCVNCVDWMFTALSIVAMHIVWFIHEVRDLSQNIQPMPGSYWVVRGLNLLGSALGLVSLTTMDAWILLAPRVKACVLTIMLVAIIYELYKSYKIHEWGGTTWCAAEGWCVEPRRLHLSAVSNVGFLLTKFLIAYVFGAEFVLLKTQLVRQPRVVQKQNPESGTALSGTRIFSIGPIPMRSNDSASKVGSAPENGMQLESRCQEIKKRCQESEKHCREVESRVMSLQVEAQSLERSIHDLRQTKLDLEILVKGLKLEHRMTICKKRYAEKE